MYISLSCTGLEAALPVQLLYILRGQDLVQEMRFAWFTKALSERDILDSLRTELPQSSEDILSFWERTMFDTENGGCFGMMTSDQTLLREADKGLVMHCRVLWSFAFAARKMSHPSYTEIAHGLYQFLITHFYDHQHGGFYWLTDYRGQVIDSSKQIYGQAFAIYALSEYYGLTKDPRIRSLALDTFHLLYRRCTEPSGIAFINSFNRDWQRKADFRITEGQRQAPIHMNTMLHVLEAWLNLFMHTNDDQVRTKLETLQHTFHTQYTTSSGRLYRYFEEDLTPLEDTFSAGHDMEYIWLGAQTLEYLKATDMLAQHIRRSATRIKSMIGHDIDRNGALFNLKRVRGKVVQERRWWDLAESMMAYWCIYMRTHDPVFLDLCWKCWTYIKKHFIIKELNEWHWNVYSPACKGWRGYIAGPWKTPYHAMRACSAIGREAGILSQ